MATYNTEQGQNQSSNVEGTSSSIDARGINDALKAIQQESEKLGAQMPLGPNPVNLPQPCYNIGDIGPAGGIVVATPNTPGNTTQYYYEISPNDLHQNQHLHYTSQTCLYTICEWGFKGIDISTQCPVGEGINNTDNPSIFDPLALH